MKRPFAVPLLAAMLALAACTGGGATPDSSGLSASPAPSRPMPSIAPTPSTDPEPSAAPTPSTTPAGPPELAELIVSAEGLGPLSMGRPVAGEALDLVVLAEDCSEPYWRTLEAYTLADTGGYGGAGGPAFTVHSEGPDGPLRRIDVLAPAIATEEGIRIGAARSDVEAAYPGAQAEHGSGTSTVYSVPGDAGQLLIEVAGADPGYWGDAVDTVVYIRVVSPGDEPKGIAATDDIVGACLDPS